MARRIVAPRGMPDVSEDEVVELVADRVRERVYVTFTALAVLLTLNSHGHAPSASEAAISLTITTLGTVVAAFVAEVIAHLSVHAEVPGPGLLRRMSWVSFGAATAAVPPLLLLAGAGLGWWQVRTALLTGSFVLVATLVLIGWLSLRRAQLPLLHRLLALAVLAAAALIVIGLKMLVH